MSLDYLHGYEEAERARLLEQARVLENVVFDGVDFRGCVRILEPGCGTGAQTMILQERYPRAEVLGVDLMENQVAAARRLHRGNPKLRFIEGDLSRRGFPVQGERFDGAFLCWFLEHVRDPLQALRNIRAALTPGARLFAREVFNPVLHFHPSSRAIEAYWRAYNELQRDLGGNPEIGARLSLLLRQAGFEEVRADIVSRAFDAFGPDDRDRHLDYWLKLMLSPAPRLLEERRVSMAIVEEMKRDFAAVRRSPDGVFLFGFVRASAAAPG